MVLLIIYRAGLPTSVEGLLVSSTYHLVLTYSAVQLMDLLPFVCTVYVAICAKGISLPPAAFASGACVVYILARPPPCRRRPKIPCHFASALVSAFFNPAFLFSLFLVFCFFFCPFFLCGVIFCIDLVSHSISSVFPMINFLWFCCP